MNITQGPFAGTQVPTEEVVYLPSYSGDEPVPFWPTQARTPMFLKLYPPADGWQIIVESAAGPFDLTDTRVQHDASASMLVQPTTLFIAKLCKEGHVFAQATTLAIIDGPSAWEKGETVARGRLYEACGLPGFLNTPMTGDDSSTRNTSTGYHTKVPVVSAPSPSESIRKIETGEVKQVETPATNKDAEQEDEAQDNEQTDSTANPSTTAAATPCPELIKATVDENLLEQIKVLAQSQGVSVPSIASNQEAKEFYKKLLKGEVQRDVA